MPHKILIVDDQPVYTLLAEKAISATNSSVSVLKASNGKEACSVGETHLPHIILMDWEMPQMSGIDAVKQLKSNPKTAHIPIIMVTSRSRKDNLKEALAAGATDFLQKPFQKDLLIQKIEKVLKSSMVA